MRERLPRYLIIAGSGALVVGVIVTSILVARRSLCSANPYMDNSGCLSYDASIHWAFALLVLGAALFVAAGLAASKRVQRGTAEHQGPRNEDHPAESD